MAYTDFQSLSESQLTSLHDTVVSAISELVGGAAAVRFVIDGDEVSYARADLPQLRRLLSDVGQALAVKLAGASGAVTAFRVSGGKGL
ncbi:MAG: hypothetical protein KQH59_18240 [Desulfobulbaceae bacterium]|nr:hypothetical protein [Desulfobulbaceae bacterium]